MPFDGIEFEKPETVRQLEAAKALISDPAKWAQGSAYYNGEGLCLEAAVSIAAGIPLDHDRYIKFHDVALCGAGRLVYRAAKEQGFDKPHRLNDDTDFETVHRCIARAIELAWAAHRETVSSIG